jgi:hypothetical protein
MKERDERRYERMATEEARPAGRSRDGASLRGAAAASLGEQMLLEALGSDAAVAKAVGRPKLGGATGNGEASPTLRVRVTQDRKERLERLRLQQHRRYTSDLVREAIDEYLERHEVSAA